MNNVTIIAELGINHNGSFDQALMMISAAKAAGIEIVKFQHYDALKLLGPDSPYLSYASQCQFTKEQHEKLKSFCDAVGVEYLVSVFDVNDVPWADTLCKRHKVASRMNKDQDFIDALVKTGKEVIISINSPIQYRPGLRNMFCVTKYPTMESELMEAVSVCNKDLGLSSHCSSIQPTLKAISNGATLIEHHVTIDKDGEGCDHSSSITFNELRKLNRFANELEIVNPH